MSQEEPSDRKPDPWPLWMAGHAQLKFVMTECSKTEICLTGLILFIFVQVNPGAVLTIVKEYIGCHTMYMFYDDPDDVYKCQCHKIMRIINY